MAENKFIDILISNLKFAADNKLYGTNVDLYNWLHDSIDKLGKMKNKPKQEKPSKTARTRYDDIVERTMLQDMDAKTVQQYNGYSDYMDMSNMPSF